MSHDTTVHPRHGAYANGVAELGVLDVERMQSHPAIAGEFRVDVQHGANGFRVVNSAVPDLVLETRDRPDAHFLADLLNVAASQLRTEDAPAVATRATPGTPRHALEVRLAKARADRHALEVDEWGTYADGTVRRQSAQTSVGTPALRQRHDALTVEITGLERELGLEISDSIAARANGLVAE